VRVDDLYVEDLIPGPDGLPTRSLNVALFSLLRRGPIAGHDDIEVAIPLAQLIHEELEKYGTAGGEEMTDAQMREALLALRATVERLGLSEFDPPYRDFGSFYNFWKKRGASGTGGWQARRDLLAEDFEPLHDKLALLENRALSSSLVEPISPAGRTGWSSVDTEIGELRRHFLNARTAQDYRGVGLDCVAVTEALSRQVYEPTRHLREGEEEPSVDKTKQRLDRFVDDAVPGSDNAALRKLARSVIEYAQHVKHSETPTRREAGIAADAVIQLANLLRRLEEEA